MKKVLSVLLAITMLLSATAVIEFEALAAVPATSITRLTPFKKQIKVFVKKNTKVSGYQVKYADNNSFKNAKTRTLKGNSKTMLRLMKLGHKKTYYFKVRAYKGKKYSKWSKVKSTTTNNRMDERYLSLMDEVYNAAKYEYATDEESAKNNLSKNAYKFFVAWNSYSSNSYKRYDDLNYGFVDLDSNGIDELILGEKDYTVYGIFTISGGKLTFVYGQYGRMLINVYGKTVYTYFHGGHNLWQHQFDKLPKNKTALTTYQKYYYYDGTYTDLSQNEVLTSTVDSFLQNIKNGGEPNYKYVKDLVQPSGSVSNVSGAKCYYTTAYDEKDPIASCDALLMNFKKVSGATGYQYKIIHSYDTTPVYVKVSGNSKTKAQYLGDVGPIIYVRAYKTTSKGTVYSKSWTLLYNKSKKYPNYKGKSTFQAINKAGYVRIR